MADRFALLNRQRQWIDQSRGKIDQLGIAQRGGDQKTDRLFLGPRRLC